MPGTRRNYNGEPSLQRSRLHPWIEFCYANGGGMNMKQLTCALAVTLVTAASASAQPASQPAQAGQQGQPAQGQQATAPKAGETITVTGCLAAGTNNTFTLTSAAPAMSEAPTGTTATTPAGTKVTKTISYTLTGGT